MESSTACVIVVLYIIYVVLAFLMVKKLLKSIDINPERPKTKEIDLKEENYEKD